jgi:hypothetical protein
MADGVPQLEKAEHLREFAPKIFEKPDTASGKGKGGP